MLDSEQSPQKKPARWSRTDVLSLGPVDDPHGLDDRQAVARELAEQAVFPVREPVRQLLQRVEHTRVLDEANDVARDPALDDGEPVRLPFLQRPVPREVEKVGMPGARD